MRESLKNKIIGWWRLFRLPNLFTIPGDPLFGYLVGGGVIKERNIIFVIFASLFSYLFGLVTNDIVDIEEDSQKRPDRPLPSGVVSHKSAKFAAFLFVALALLFAGYAGKLVLIFDSVLIFFIIAYNFYFKRKSILGPFLLASCRVLNLMMGLAVVNFTPHKNPIFIPAVLTWFFYIFSVSFIAHTEADKSKRNILSMASIILAISILWFLYGIASTFWIVLLMREIPPGILLGAVLSLLIIGFSLKNFIVWYRKPEPLWVQKGIGELIGNIILFQASACAFAGFPHAAVIVFFLWVPWRILSRFFYGS